MKKASCGIANIFSRSCFTGRNLKRVTLQQNKKQKHVSVKLASANLGLACVE